MTTLDDIEDDIVQIVEDKSLNNTNDSTRWLPNAKLPVENHTKSSYSRIDKLFRLLRNARVAFAVDGNRCNNFGNEE